MSFGRIPNKTLLLTAAKSFSQNNAAARSSKITVSAARNNSDAVPLHALKSTPISIGTRSFGSVKSPETKAGEGVNPQAKYSGEITDRLSTYCRKELRTLMGREADVNALPSNDTANNSPSSNTEVSHQTAVENKPTDLSLSTETKLEVGENRHNAVSDNPSPVSINFASKIKALYQEGKLSAPVKYFNENIDSKADAEAVKDVSMVKKEIDIGKPFDARNLKFTQSFQDTANQYKAVISLRYPSEIGQYHLAHNFPTKNFHVKAKSSISGPMAGFIAAKAKYSKAAASAEGLKQQTKTLDDAKQKGAGEIPLKLFKDQLELLIKKGAITIVEGEPNKYTATFESGPNTSITETFTISPPDYKVFDQDDEPVLVLSNPKEKGVVKVGSQKKINEITDLPITADYDLFSIIPNKNHSNNPVPIQVKAIAKRNSITDGKSLEGNLNLSEVKNNIDKAVKAFTTDVSNASNMDVDKGNFHRYGESIINSINIRVKEKEDFQGGKLVWHGDELNNPYSKGFDEKDKPLFFIPGFENPVQIENENELNKLYKYLKDNGYASP